MQGMLVQRLGREDPLEREMAIHFSILPGKSHRQKSLVGYSPRAGHNRATKQKVQARVLSLGHNVLDLNLRMNQIILSTL